MVEINHKRLYIIYGTTILQIGRLYKQKAEHPGPSPKCSSPSQRNSAMCNSLSETVGQARFLNSNTNIDSRRFQLLCISSLQLCKWTQKSLPLSWHDDNPDVELRKIKFNVKLYNFITVGMSCKFWKHDKF